AAVEQAPVEQAAGDQPSGNEAAGNQPGGNQPGGNQPGGNQQGGNQPGGTPVPVPPGGGHPGRKKKILAWTAGGVAVVLLIALGGAYAVYRHLNGNLHQLNISGDLGTQPVDTHPQAENIMIIG